MSTNLQPAAAPPPAPSLPRPRHRRISRHSVYGIDVTTKPTIRRLARRGGVKRMKGLVYEETRGCLFPYLQGLLRDTILHTTHDYRTTISAKDVVHALRRSGRNLYGFEA
ncbi:histone H4 [Mycena albidolilacea]|uniref:Histone H4 n=1 Tax=Mycena albidolilacea TaxID=1033008 RepID=A0AAD7EVU1_9AGAR|nr:histone H4 [Mycena albidolilacea]